MEEHYKNIIISDERRAENKRLCDKFPFLIPAEKWSDWNYEFTELDDMPSGWRKAFGEQMCEEIMDELNANNMVDNYQIAQIKEKYGTLRWYDNGFTEHGKEILDKYEELSKHTCISCGKPATLISRGWISPWCYECAEKIEAYVVPIEEFYK